MKIKLLAFLAFLALLLPSSGLSAPVYDDLWDISNGGTIDGTSGALYYSYSYRSDAINMIGGSGGTIEVGNLLFRDHDSSSSNGHVQQGYVHWVEWHTPNPVTLRSFNLIAMNEGMDERAFSNFELFAGSAYGSYASIYDSGSVNYSGYEEFESDVAATIAQYFRIEFVQSGPLTDLDAIGPRIIELDGFDTFLDGSGGGDPVPEPTTILLFGLGLLGLAGVSRRKK